MPILPKAVSKPGGHAEDRLDYPDAEWLLCVSCSAIHSTTIARSSSLRGGVPPVPRRSSCGYMRGLHAIAPPARIQEGGRGNFADVLPLT